MVYPDQRGSSVTLIGALGTCIPGYVYFHTTKSTNKEDCSDFLEKLRDKLPPHKPGAKKPIVIIDNHPYVTSCQHRPPRLSVCSNGKIAVTGDDVVNEHNRQKVTVGVGLVGSTASSH